MNIPRLRHLITVLETVPEDHFDLNHWKCGTTACACGWAGQDPVFNAQGFILVPSGDGRYGEPVLPDPDGGQLTGFDAVEAFFGLTERQAESLFMTNAYDNAGIAPSRANVINSIKFLLGDEL